MISLNLPELQSADSLSDNIDHPTLKAIIKWRNHPSVLAVTAVHENRERFTFSSVTLADVAKEINNILNSLKAIQEADLSVKLLKDNKDFFAAYIAKYFNDSLKSAKFPNCLKLASITPVFKKNAHLKTITDQQVCCLSSLKYLNALFVTNFQYFSKGFFQGSNVVSVRATAPNIVCL